MELFYEQFVTEAIERIQKFGMLMDSLGVKDIVVGFSGGKDSLVVLDLVRKVGIRHKAYFNHSFESVTTLCYIRDNFPQVEFRRGKKEGFIENMYKQGIVPTAQKAYCCKDYKHPASNSNESVILGVRRQESKIRSRYNVLTMKSKREIKRNINHITEYFEERCVANGGNAKYVLYPILDWTDDMVWEYINRGGWLSIRNMSIKGGLVVWYA